MALPAEVHQDGNICPECGMSFALEVLSSAAGYYIGTKCDCGPNSRESGYFKTYTVAEETLKHVARRIWQRG